ncbi:MAG: pyruvate kinase [Mycoplasmoidaceae bacterium]|nr:pyruvate kinase [Mycoplasmoidaceae bacterium]
MSKTKIVCTIGPSSNNPIILKKMAEAGMACARINMSHGDFAFYKNVVNNIRKIKGHKVFIMTDTKGPEIRICELKKPLAIKTGANVTILTKVFKTPNKPNTFCVYDSTKKYNMAKDLKKGERIAVDDGKLYLVVKSVDVKKGIILARAMNNHTLLTNKRINLPDSSYSMPFLSEKDIQNLKETAKLRAESIALSFVCNAKNVKDARKILVAAGGKKIKIFSKIETQDALNNIGSIIKESDGILVARGDLALETPYYDVPYWQEKIIKMCKKARKPVVVCTQMLDSLERNVHPTRAEVTDVYLATSMGADATMLSGETANGCDPVNAVKKMQAIINAATKRPINK